MNISDRIKKLKEAATKKLQGGGAIYPQPPASNQNNYFDFAQAFYPPQNTQPNFRPFNTELSPTTAPEIGSYLNPNAFELNPMAVGNQITEYQSPQEAPLDPSLTDNNIYQDTTNLKIFNPYTGLSLENALFGLGQSLTYNGENKGANTLRGIASGAKVALGGARTLLSGAGYEKANTRAYDNYRNMLYNGDQGFTQYQEGGEVTNAQMLTGAFIPDIGQGNAEIEHGEVVKNGQTGDVQMAVGEKHDNGGITTTLPNGSKVLSDYTKIGAQNAKAFRKDLDIKVKATDTFAAVMDKYNNKIGWTDLIDTETKTIEEIGTQNQISETDADTKDLNLGYLQTKLEEVALEKDVIKPLQDEAFEKIFAKQEKDPKKTTNKMQEGGTYDENVIALAKQYNLSPERVLQLLHQSNPQQDISQQVQQALAQGTPPEQIIQQLVANGITEEQAQQLVSVPQMQAGGVFFQPSIYAQDSYGYQPYLGANTNAAGVATEEEILARLQLQNQNLPYLVRQSGIYSDNAGAFPNLRNTGKFQESYDNYVKKTVLEIDANPYLTPEEKVAQKATAQSQLLGISNKDGKYDNIYGQETSSRTNFVLPYLTQQDKEKYKDLKFLGDALDEKGQIKPEYAGLDDKTKALIQDTYTRSGADAFNIGLGVVPTQEAAAMVNVQAPQTINRQRNLLTTANLPVDFVLPPSPMQDVYKASVSLGRIDPSKISIEPNLIEADRQRQSTVDSLSFLPDSQRAAVIASVLGQTQNATNQAITQAETYNADAQTKADMINLQQSDKQQLLDEQFAQTYEQKALAALTNTNMDLRAYFQQNNLNNRQNYADIRDLNLLNQMYPQYQTNGSEVFFNNAPLNLTPSSSTLMNNYNNLSTEEKKIADRELAKRIGKAKADAITKKK